MHCIASDGALPETFIVVYLKRLSRRWRQISASLLVKRDGRQRRRPPRVDPTGQCRRNTIYWTRDGQTSTGRRSADDVDFQLATRSVAIRVATNHGISC